MAGVVPKRGKRRSLLGTSEAVLLALVLALSGYAVVTGGTPQLLQAAVETGDLLSDVWLALLLGFLLAGFVAVLLPSKLVARYLGAESGLTGLLLATLFGALTPGGPYVQFPLVAALHKSGAGPGPLAAYLTSWNLLPLHRTLVWELPFLGAPFTIARLLTSLAVPVVIGLGVPLLLRVAASHSRRTAALEASPSADERGGAKGDASQRTPK